MTQEIPRTHEGKTRPLFALKDFIQLWDFLHFGFSELAFNLASQASFVMYLVKVIFQSIKNELHCVVIEIGLCSFVDFTKPVD